MSKKNMVYYEISVDLIGFYSSIELLDSVDTS